MMSTKYVMTVYGCVNKKGKNMHSKEYVIKIIEECGYTTYEVMRQVMEYTGSIEYGLNPFEYLRHFNAKDIRKILKFKID
jgi:hypothetical protein